MGLKDLLRQSGRLPCFGSSAAKLGEAELPPITMRYFAAKIKYSINSIEEFE